MDESVVQMAKGPYREVLDWLVDQFDRLDAHTEDLVAHAGTGEVDDATIEARRQAILQAHAWLAEQLATALRARGMQIAA